MKAKIMVAIMFLVGALMCAFGNKMLLKQHDKLETFTETTAIVVEHETCMLDEDSYGEMNVLEYTVDGRKYRINGDSCATRNSAIGKEVKIKYNPNNPQEAVVASTNIIALIVVNLTSVLLMASSIFVFKMKGPEKKD